MKLVKETQQIIPEAVSVLNKGGLVIFPCETVYGVAADASNEAAVRRLNAYKQRPTGKPYAIMVSDMAMAQQYVEINQTARNLYKKFLPGPLTIVSKGKHKVASGVESENGSLGVRIPDYDFLLRLITSFGKPIVATSANASYKKRPYKLDDVFENISQDQKQLIDLAIDAGELPHNEPSTVVDTTLDDATILRQGEIRFSEENRVISRSEENTQNIGKELWQKYEHFLHQRAIVFALSGEMGAGKTQLTKGIAKAMGITDTVVSPTFSLEIEYDNLVHIDAWRIENEKEVEQMGYVKRISEKSVIVIEWAEKIGNLIRRYDDDAIVVWIKIKYGFSENERIISWGVEA